MRILFSVLLAAASACALLNLPAQAAQRDRVFVASYGSDSNPCTFGSPCKTFQNALSAVAAGGEIFNQPVEFDVAVDEGRPRHDLAIDEWVLTGHSSILRQMT